MRRESLHGPNIRCAKGAKPNYHNHYVVIGIVIVAIASAGVVIAKVRALALRPAPVLL